MPIVSYLNFDQNAVDAIKYYQEIFETEEPNIMKYGDFNDPSYDAPEHIRDLVMHCEIKIFGERVMIADTPRGFGMDYIAGNNITVAIVSSDIEKLKKAWSKLSKGSKIISQFEKTFFSEGYGFLFDKFGIGWQFIHE
jgi:PhnB protein